MDPTFPLVPIANFLACLLIILSLSKSMFQSWNIGVLSYAFWTAVPSFTIAVNTIVWSDNVKDVAPVWCDIGQCLLIPINYALLTIYTFSNAFTNGFQYCNFGLSLHHNTETIQYHSIPE